MNAKKFTRFRRVVFNLIMLSWDIGKILALYLFSTRDITVVRGGGGGFASH